jgi:hypothetical protein
MNGESACRSALRCWRRQAVTVLLMLREDGRGQRVHPVELQLAA